MIQMSREAWRATIEKYRLATGYPDPQVSVTYFPQPIETRLGPQDWNASISQMIPFPGKLSKAGAVVEADARIARLKLDQAVRDVVVSIRESVYELGYIRRARRIAAHNMELLQDLRKVSETAYAQDRTALLDMVKAQSQSGQLRYDMLLLEDLEQTEITRLNGFLNRPPEALIGRIEPDQEPSFNYDLLHLYRLAEENQEEIRMAGAGIDKADANLDLARYEYLPEFRVGFFYAAIGDPDVPQDPPDAGDDALGIQFGMTLPLWFGKNKSRVSQARAEMAQAKAAKSGRINETHTQIHALFFRMQNARRLIELYRDELLPQAARSMQIAETWFRQGESSFSDFIETQAVNYNFQLALARAQADYGKFRARLERLLGSGIAESGREAEQRKPEEANRLQDQDAGVNP
jgi:outer membrane protein TolC